MGCRLTLSPAIRKFSSPPYNNEWSLSRGYLYMPVPLTCTGAPTKTDLEVYDGPIALEGIQCENWFVA